MSSIDNDQKLHAGEEFMMMFWIGIVASAVTFALAPYFV